MKADEIPEGALREVWKQLLGIAILPDDAEIAEEELWETLAKQNMPNN